jgi:HTH-type transcriptional regulator, glycine betaine synthesis regulator
MSENGHSAQKDLQIVHESMLDGLGQLATYFGFSKVMGQLYGVLLMNPEPMCLDDMMDNLDISKASVSMNMRTLEHMGMVRQVWVRGSSGRRKFYQAETDFWQIISNILAKREMRDVERALTVLADNAERLSKGMPEMSEDEQKVAELYLDRVTQIQALFRFAQMVMSTILARDFEDISKIELE